MEFTNILTVIAVAAAPISELRGAIPLAVVAYHFPWYYAFLFAVIGNLIPVPLILLFLEAVSQLLNRVPFFRRLLESFFARVRRRSKVVVRYELIGMALFVALPLPFTGAWTGSILAVMLGLRFRFALISITIGVLVAGIIVTLATLLGWTIIGTFSG